MTGLALLAATAAAAGVLRGYTGFGGALLMAPVFVVLLGPTVALSTILVVNVATAWQLLLPSWHRMRGEVVWPMVAGALAGTPLGLAVVASADPATVRVSVGIAVAASGAAMLAGWRSRRAAGLSGSLATGAVSGVLNGIAGIGGPPAVLWMLAHAADPARDRASIVVFVAVTQVATAAAALLGGFMSAADAARAAVLALPYLAGGWAGARLFRIAPARFYRAVAAAVLVALGLATAAP